MRNFFAPYARKIEKTIIYNKKRKKHSKKGMKYLASRNVIEGLYYSAEKRNQKTGETVFFISPLQSCEYAVNGLLRCRGAIPVCEKGMPVIVKGYEKEGLFITEHMTTHVTGYEAVSAIASLADPDLTDSDISALFEIVKGDIFDFCRSYRDPVSEIFNLFMNRRSGRSRQSQKERLKDAANRIVRFAEKAEENRELSDFLLSYDVPIDRIEMMFKKGITADEIKRNPYRIFRRYDIPQITADAIAWDTAFEERETSHDGHSDVDFSELRLAEYSKTAADFILRSGSTTFDLDQLVRAMNSVLKRASISKIHIGRAIANFCVCDSGSRMSYHEYDGRQYIETDSVWQEENTAIFHVKRLQRGKSVRYKCRSVDDVQKEVGMIYNDGQRSAFEIPKTGGIKILTGPPGSGKTAVIKGLIESFSAKGRTIRLAATTGMAAKVMSAATGKEAETLNMMLNVIPFDDSVISRSASDPVDADFIIVDEVSMMGLKMFSCLVQAVKSGAVLLLVGDENQLQSVEYGNVLHDLIESGVAEVYRLTEILRQSGTICENAAEINKGSHCIKTDATFEIVSCISADDMLNRLKKNYRELSSQVLCPVRKGSVSVSSVNSMLEKTGSEVLASYGQKDFHVGDKIVMTRTDYSAGYINGDIGYVRGSEGELLICEFDGVKKKMDRQSMHDMEHADCITIHKSQGNEFQTVHVLLPEEAACMMTRRLLYTAVTRAKSKVIIYTSGGTFESAISNKAERGRSTLLAHRLKSETEK